MWAHAAFVCRTRSEAAFVVRVVVLLAATLAVGACSSNDEPGASGAKELDWPCEIASGGEPPDSLKRMGCVGDFAAFASLPLDASIPGARSAKVLIDLYDNDAFYFQNSVRYPIHYDFAKAHLSGMGIRLISTIDAFNPQYTAPEADRRFLLGAVTYYDGPKVWALEIAPYDTSTPAMIAKLYNAVKQAAFFGPVLAFHPTSDSVEAQAKKLSSDILIKTTNDLFAAIDYQPLNVGEAAGTVKFVRAAELGTVYVNARDIVVLDEVPNDITPTAALVTQQFQTPLSHINVLARNRGTPNMGLRNAATNATLLALKGKPAMITVGLFEWSIREIAQAESDAWWDSHKPPVVTLPPFNRIERELRDIEKVTEHTDQPPYATLAAIKAAILAYGAKTAHYSVFSTDPKVPNKKGFGIPVVYYAEFMERNKFDARVRAFRDDPEFVGNDAVREAKLAELRADIVKGDIDPAFQALLKEKLDKDFPGRAMRFRSSTNAEDLDGYPCAGCYDSHTGDPNEFGGDQLTAALSAIRKTWATTWNRRTYDERQLNSIEHNSVAMGLLVHTNFPDEEANGVAITANIFDPTGNSPGFYVNVQKGGQFEVVHPPPGVTSESFLYQFTFPNQPIIYYTSSNIVPAGTRVLTPRQVHELGVALDVIHERFSAAYRPQGVNGWYAMDCEFKFDDEANPGASPSLYVKQARPYPGPKK